MILISDLSKKGKVKKEDHHIIIRIHLEKLQNKKLARDHDVGNVLLLATPTRACIYLHTKQESME